MDCFALVAPGFEPLALQELKELLSISGKKYPQIIEFSCTPEQFITYLYHAQTAQHLLLGFGKADSPVTFRPAALPWRDILPGTFSFKIEVLGVSGQEAREAIAKSIAGQLFLAWESAGLKPSLEMKHPEFMVVAFHNGKEYFIGLDAAGQELHRRPYRVFTHQASMKGDLAYFFVRASGFQPGEKLLVGFLKDGTIAIEAALYAHALPAQQGNLAWKKLPVFQDADVATPARKKSASAVVHGFDESRPSIEAARKNALLAKVKQYVDFQKYSLEELDVRYGDAAFDRMIVQLTTKDEKKLHELVYQARHILRKRGTLFLCTATEMDLPTPEGFRLTKRITLARGGAVYCAWRFVRTT